jgi:hypothetical protein
MPTTVRVLILTDADGAYVAHNNRFAMTELLEALQADAGDGYKFVVTKAHRYSKAVFESRFPSRQQGADAGKDHFVFDSSFTVSLYDELWLFGVASSNPNGPYKDLSGYALTPAETQLVQQFMDAGGGVFAVGDHDDLGRDLCASLPRVRSMRRWQFDYVAAKADYSGYDEGSGDNPPVSGPYRHSTIVQDADGHYEFDNQSDDLPQTIRPVITTLVSGTPYLTQVESYPHPLLCGMDGVIDVLPDHMHEGQCQVPADLTGKYVSGKQTLDEYPSYLGQSLAPQVVAWEDIAGRAAEGGFTDPGKSAGFDDNETLYGDTSGAIAAWDGQLVNAGRVVVDSTFHHFFDVNIVGVSNDLTHGWGADEGQTKLLGLKNSPSPQAQAAYKAIRQYWRNIARWLAPANLQVSWSLQWIKLAASDARLREGVGIAHDLDGKMRLGAGMDKIMGAFLPPCAILSISSVGVPNPLSVILRHWFILMTLPDPGPEGPNWRLLPLSVSAISQLALGVSALTVREASRKEGVSDAELVALLRTANAHAMHQLFGAQLRGLERGALNAAHWLKQIQQKQ